MGRKLDRRPPGAGTTSVVTDGSSSRYSPREECGTVTLPMADQEQAPSRPQLSFSPSGRQVRVPRGVTMFDAASWNGIAIDSTCGGHGTCKKCRVQVTAGHSAPSALDLRAFSPDELRAGWRLACRAEVSADLEVEVPPLVTRPKAATVGVGRKVILRPAVQKRYLELAHPSLSDQLSDSERLLHAMDDLELRVDLHALRSLGRVLRQSDFKVTAVVSDDVLIDVEPGDTTDRMFGVAFDLGTTTCVGTLLDLSTGTPVAVDSMLNRQQPFGADVITRISAIMMDAGPSSVSLRSPTRRSPNWSNRYVSRVASRRRRIYDVAVAGNATMAHIALGIDPEPLGVAPFIMSARRFPELLASDLSIDVHPRARAVVFPGLGAYVGGDITAGLLASGMDRDTRTRLFIDIGTNCEIVLGNSLGLVATAAPAGPAFEGAQIRCGMRAADGAIEVVKMTPEELTLQVVGNTEPVGLCGSGLVDAIAELVRLGLVDASGRLVDPGTAQELAPALADRLTTIREERVFVLYESDSARVYLSRARRTRAAVRQGRHRHGLDTPLGGCRSRGRRCATGPARRVLWELSLGSERRPARPRAVATGHTSR